jgi:hypothetical protein
MTGALGMTAVVRMTGAKDWIPAAVYPRGGGEGNDMKRNGFVKYNIPVRE